MLVNMYDCLVGALVKCCLCIYLFLFIFSTSIRFKMVYARLRKPICAQPRFFNVALKTATADVRLSDFLRPFKNDRRARSRIVVVIALSVVVTRVVVVAERIGVAVGVVVPIAVQAVVVVICLYLYSF